MADWCWLYPPPLQVVGRKEVAATHVPAPGRSYPDLQRTPKVSKYKSLWEEAILLMTWVELSKWWSSSCGAKSNMLTQSLPRVHCNDSTLSPATRSFWHPFYIFLPSSTDSDPLATHIHSCQLMPGCLQGHQWRRERHLRQDYAGCSCLGESASLLHQGVPRCATSQHDHSNAILMPWTKSNSWKCGSSWVFLSHPQSLTWHRSLDPHIAEKGKSCLTCQAVQSRRGIGFWLLGLGFVRGL